jgi:hypothetical protein
VFFDSTDGEDVMALLPEWRHVLRRAWSMRLMLLAGLLSGCEAVLPMFSDSIPRGVFAGLTMAVIPLAMWARVVAQKGLRDD